ncbi:MAG: hypothetical protein U9R74_12055 [Pseudomonadota bacterium]|nr:hypothetical protein [Pseudomonadota bacterium]
MNHITSMKCAVVIAIGTTAVPCAAYTQDTDTWQMRRLFEPSETHLRAETRGSVMIYEGLEETTVNRAMDTHFSRIDNMMFVGTVRNDAEGKVLTNPKTGDVITEDDGCD